MHNANQLLSKLEQGRKDSDIKLLLGRRADNVLLNE